MVNKENFNKSLVAFKEMSNRINNQLNQFTKISEGLHNKINSAIEPMRITMERFQEWNKVVFDKLEPTLKVLKKIGENHQKGKRIRGEIITSVIDLDELMEEIIVNLFIRDEKKEDFIEFVLNDEGFSSFFKKKILDRSGLLREHKNLSKNIGTLIEIRNTLAHSKYRPSVETVTVLHQKKIKDINDLKKEFDNIFKEVIGKLKEILKKISK